MRADIFKSATTTMALAASLLLLGSGAALAAQQINLTAGPSNAVLPDGTSAPMWGYSCGALASGSTATCAALNSAAVTSAATTSAAAVMNAWSPVIITVPSGQDLQINLTNNLAFPAGSATPALIPTSLTIIGQLGGGLGTPGGFTASPDHSAAQQLTWPIADPTTTAPAPAQGMRVQSFGTEVSAVATTVTPTCAAPTAAPATGCGTLTWVAPRPGTYLLESGTHPSIQGPMGLYGIVVVTDTTTAPATAYPSAGTRAAVTYNADLAMLLSEIDPVQNAAVSAAVNTTGFVETNVFAGYIATGNPTPRCKDLTGAPVADGACYPPAVNYIPTYYLINGRGFDRTNPAAAMYPLNPASVTSGNLLVRLVNGGLRMHVPSIVGATTAGAALTPGMSLIAEDGNVLPGVSRVQSEVFMPAGKTIDVMINVPPGSGALPIFDRQLSLSANTTARDAGMLAYIGANGATPPLVGSQAAAAVKDDTYPLLLGQTLIIADPSQGVTANDTNVRGVTLFAAPTAGKLTLSTNGTFVYVPNPSSTIVPDSFQYCANGSMTAGVCSSGLIATVSLTASAVSDAGITCAAASFTAAVANQIAVKPPGILAACKDAAGLALSIQGATATTPLSVGSALIDLNGGFTLTGSGTQTFNVTAQNGKGQTTPIDVTVTFPTGSGLSVTVLDGQDHTTKITDYRWVIEEDRTFYVDPRCTTNPLPADCPVATPSGAPVNYGTNFHTSFMPLIASGCTGPLSCESGQTLQGVAVVCDVGNGACRATQTSQTPTDPKQVQLDPTKRYYISVLPGDAANPFIDANATNNCQNGQLTANQTNSDGTPNRCGHGMGGAPIAAACPSTSTTTACTASFQPVTVLSVAAPLPTATMSVFVFEDDWPLNGEQGAGGGVDVIAANEPGLGSFQVTIFDQAGGTGDATGQPTYDMFNQPLSNSLAGTIDPVTGLDACPISPVVTANVLQSGSNATPEQCAADPTLKSCQRGQVGMIVTCPTYESDGRTLSPMAGQAIIKNLYPGRYGVSALPSADRIARGEEWVQTNTLDGQKSHDSFMRVGEPGYFQEFGPAGYHVSIGFANPKLINDRRTNSTQSGMCDPLPPTGKGGGLTCNWEVKGKVYGSRLSRTPDQRLYSSGSRDALAFTQCYVSLGDPDGAEIAFTKCDADGSFDFTGVPAGNWKITTLDQWNDQIIDGITQGVGVGCSGTVSGLCGAGSVASTCTGASSSGTTCDMGEIGVHQWQADLYTRSFIDTTGSGVSDDSKPGLPLVATNIRFRDGSYSNFNSTDLNGYAGFNEVFPLFNWYVVETDSTRYKTTGVHVIYDAGGPADGSASCNSTSPCGSSSTAANFANTYEKFPLPVELMPPGSVPCANADCPTESIANGFKRPTAVFNSTGRIDPPYWFGSYGWQGYIGQGNFLEFGKKPYASGETGPIHGHVIYASTRPFDDPQLLLQLSWEPMIPHVRVNLYKEDVASDGKTPTLTLVDYTYTSSFDDWAQGFRSDGAPNVSCPGQTANASGTQFDPFYYALADQPSYLDLYNKQHAVPGTFTAATPTTLPYHSQYKCYDGMHSWNQLQPAPYDGMYSFPSVNALDPVTGKPSGTNCTACSANPDTTDPYRVGTPMLPPGKYVVEVVVPPGYELVKEEDKNILIGDNYIAPPVVQIPGLGGAIYILPDQAELSAQYNPNNPQNATTSLGRNSSLPSHEGDTGSVESFWPCVGAVRQVPDFISLYPQSGEVAPFAGAMRPLCDRKEVNLTEQSSALVKFYLFTSTHVASHFQGIILDDFTAEFDPFSPQFGEKFAPSYVPVGVKDWTGNEINRVYSDQFGLYNGLNYSTWEVNPPNPTGYGPTMMTMCMNDAGMRNDPLTGLATPDPLFQQGYSQFCYELPFMPGQTGYFDTPVVPVQSFSEGYNHADCAYPDTTPAIASVVNTNAESTLPAGSGPWLSATGSTHSITIKALGDQKVDWYGYSGPSTTATPYNQQKITRHYGFGLTQGTGSAVLVGLSDGSGPASVPLIISNWGDTQIVASLPSSISSNPHFACPLSQQSKYGGSVNYCGQLVITAANGKQSVDTVTVTVGGKTPTLLAAGATIQSAIDAAKPGDMIIVPPGTYNEMVVMWKPVRLQGVGASSSIIDANTQPAGKLLTPWRQKVVCLFGLTSDGRPRAVSDTTCDAGLNYALLGDTTRNFATMTVDRLPFEATLGWDASLNGNLAEQLSEPSLLGAYEGAAITVLGKGVKFPRGTALGDAFGATTGAAFPTDTVLLTAADCGGSSSNAPNPYPSNFYCNPSSIDGLGIRDSSQGGGGIFVHAYAHNLQIANNRIYNNEGTLSGGITVGAGEHPDVALAGAATPTSYPVSCETSRITNLSLPFCFDNLVNIHHNAIVGNSSEGDELFSSTPAGAGGVSINTGSDYYQFKNNWVCGNLSTGDGGGFAHIGFNKNGHIENNTIIFNQSTNPTITTNGGGLLIMGAPDADPTSCGVANDQDCLPAPGEISPSDGTGPGLVINANLILGNAADSGSGGGLRLQAVNGTDVLNFPDGSRDCNAALSASCRWNSVNVTNNIIVNNVAGWDGAGVSLLDSLAVNIVNDTIASNDSTASSGTLFQTLFAPTASSTSPTSGVICGATAGQSCPQVSGLVSVSNSPVLVANVNQAAGTKSCPPGHGSGTACFSHSIPLMFNDAIWQNRSFYIGVGDFGAATSGQDQQHIVSLYNAAFPAGAAGTAAGTQGATGACPAASYWEVGFRGDTNLTNHSLSGFAPARSVLTNASNYGATNSSSSASPAFTSQYCNGSRTPPEASCHDASGNSIPCGWAVPPGTNEGNAFPNSVFTLTPSAVVDEGNNWINLRWGPLSLNKVDPNASPAAGATVSSYTGAVLANYAPTSTSAIDAGLARLTVGSSSVSAPDTDFFGTARPRGSGYDIGAIEVNAAPVLSAGASPSSLTFSGLVGVASAAQTVTVTNTGNTALAGGTFAFSATTPYTRATTAQGGAGSCGTTLAAGASCTYNIVFTASATGAAPAVNLTVTYTGAPVAGSPVALSGTGVATRLAATVSPTTLTFGNQAIGSASVKTVTVTNTGNAPLAGGTYNLGGGTPQPFSRATIAQGGAGSCGATLAVGASCTYNVVFAPATGTANGTAFTRTLTVAYTGATVSGSQVTLTGTAVTPGTLSFSAAANGTLSTVLGVRTLRVTIPTPRPATVTSTVTITNTGAGGLSITGETLSNMLGADFALGTTTCSYTTALASGSTCTFNVTYTVPATAPPVPRVGSVAVTNNGSGTTAGNSNLALLGN